jgi:DNA-binding CsgD family transcriptional regulator
MAEPELCPAADASDPDPWPRSIIDALIDIAYQHECEDISNSPQDMTTKYRRLRALREQHSKRRQPYIQKLLSVQRVGQPEMALISLGLSACTLSVQEAEILCRLMNGAQAEALARELGLDERIVKDHIRSMLEKVRSPALSSSLMRKEATKQSQD